MREFVECGFFIRKRKETMKNKQQKQIRFLTEAGMIAALYVALTGLSALLGLSSGAIQLRLSEALCVLPVFTASAIPGVSVGCLIANLLFGGSIYDILFGSLATLIGAVGTYLLRGKSKWLYPLPPILANTLIVPAVLIRVYGIEDAYWFLALTVGIGEVIAAGVMGILLYNAVKGTKLFR